MWRALPEQLPFEYTSYNPKTFIMRLHLHAHNLQCHAATRVLACPSHPLVYPSHANHACTQCHFMHGYCHAGCVGTWHVHAPQPHLHHQHQAWQGSNSDTAAAAAGASRHLQQEAAAAAAAAEAGQGSTGPSSTGIDKNQVAQRCGISHLVPGYTFYPGLVPFWVGGWGCGGDVPDEV